MVPGMSFDEILDLPAVVFDLINIYVVCIPYYPSRQPGLVYFGGVSVRLLCKYSCYPSRQPRLVGSCWAVLYAPYMHPTAVPAGSRGWLVRVEVVAVSYASFIYPAIPADSRGWLFRVEVGIIRLISFYTYLLHTRVSNTT